MKQIRKKNTGRDRLIAGIRSRWYDHYEPLKLAYLRRKFEKFYGPDDIEPEIFVYTPTYNRGSILVERAVKSVLAQTYRNFHYLVIGDCCTDNTAELLSAIDDPRFEFHNIPKRGYRYPPTVENHWFAGPVVAANTALQRVQGKWIARLDDDDIWEPDHLSKVLSFALAGNWEFVTADMTGIRDGQEQLMRGDPLYGDYFKLPYPITDGYFYNPIIGGTNTVLYRSYLGAFRYNLDCWRKSHNRVNDIDLFVRLGKAGVRMGHLNEVTCRLLPRPGEQTIGLDAYRRKEKDMMEHFSF